MIQQGEMTIIDSITYRCLKIDEQGYAHLKNILHEQGRPKLVLQKYCPYIKDNQIIVPEKPKYQRPKPTTKIKINDRQYFKYDKNFITVWYLFYINSLYIL